MASSQPTGGITYTNGYGVRLPDGTYQNITNAYGAEVGMNLAVANTDGTNAVSVFGTVGLPYAITIVGVTLVAQDTTAGNITVEAPAATVVVTIAKGATSGALVGGTTLANTVVPAATNVIVKSSSAGNARVSIQYTVA